MPDFTVTLIPTVQVLRIQNPAVDTETGTQSDSAADPRSRSTSCPQDAQNLVFAQENGAALARPPAAGARRARSRTRRPFRSELLLGARFG